VAGTGAALFLRPSRPFAEEPIDPRVSDLVRTTVGIDTHNHIDVPLTGADAPGPDLDLAGEMKRSGLAAICMTFAVDYQPIRDPREGHERFANGLAAFDRLLARNGMKRSLTLAEIRAAHAAAQPTVVQAVEGAHFLEGRLERIEEACGRGLRHLGLLHDSDATPPLGDVYTNPAKFGGLTALGVDVIKECNRLGILVDLTHASAAAVRGALEVSTRPVILSHTGLDTQLGTNPDLARRMRPRLIGKELARDVAKAGGVLGVWTHLADSPAAFAQNIRAMVDVVGVDHAAIGTDTKLTAGLGRGGPGGERPGERTNRVWDGQANGFYATVVDALLKAGFAPDEIARIGGGNFCRVFDAATAPRRPAG